MKRQWAAFRRLPPGERFQKRYRQQQRQRAGKPAWKRVLPLLLVPVSLALGVVLMFIPGPAVLFFFLAGALLASHSLRVARAFDWLELKLRALLAKGRAWWSRASLSKKVPVVLAALLAVVGTGAAALKLLVWS